MERTDQLHGRDAVLKGDVMTDEAREAAWTRDRIIEVFRSRQYANPNGGPNVFTAAAEMLERDGHDIATWAEFDRWLDS